MRPLKPAHYRTLWHGSGQTSRCVCFELNSHLESCRKAEAPTESRTPCWISQYSRSIVQCWMGLKTEELNYPLRFMIISTFCYVSKVDPWQCHPVGLSVHHVGPDWRISTTTGRIDVKFGKPVHVVQKMNATNYGDPLTFPLAQSAVWNEMTQQLLSGLLWYLVQTFMPPSGCTVTTLVIFIMNY